MEVHLRCTAPNCGLEQRQTRSGQVCSEGHGGAPGKCPSCGEVFHYQAHCSYCSTTEEPKEEHPVLDTPTKKKVRIISHTTIPDDYFDREESTILLVDGVEIGQGYYRGEPEDNCRSRDYKWVEQLLKKLAESLGADVEVVEEEIKVD